MSDGAVEIGKHRIEVRCPHVENGACSDCMWPQIVPYVAARQTLDDLLPKLTMLAEAIGAFSTRAAQLAKGTEKIKEWVEIAAAAKWEMGPPSPVDAPPTPTDPETRE